MRAPEIGEMVHLYLEGRREPVPVVIVDVSPDDDTVVEVRMFLPSGVEEQPWPHRYPYSAAPTPGHWTRPRRTP